MITDHCKYKHSIALIESFQMICRVSQKTRLAGCGIETIWLIFKTELLIYQSRANLKQTILFGKLTHHLGSAMRKVPIRSLHWNRQFHVWSMIHAPGGVLDLNLYGDVPTKKIFFTLFQNFCLQMIPCSRKYR